MEARLKAQELLWKYLPILESWKEDNSNKAKQCALIAVDEIIKVCHYNSKENLSNWELVGLDDFEFSCYWNEVKEEIEKL